MKSRLLTAAIGAVTVLGIAAAAEDRYDRIEPQSMKQAVEFERHKQEAAERQARIERKRGNSEASADRSADRKADRVQQGTADRQMGDKPQRHAGKAPVNR